MLLDFGVGWRSSVSLDDAKKALEAHHPALLRCVRRAWGTWRKVAPAFAMPEPSTRAMIVWNGWTDAIRAEFGDTPSVRIVEKSDRIFLLFRNKIAVRLKKVDEKLRTSNYPTKTALQVDGQRGVPGAPMDTPILTVAYTIDPQDPTKLSSIDVIYAVDKSALWEYSLLEPAAVVQQLPLAPAPKRVGRSRVTARREAARDRGVVKLPVKKK